MARPEILGNEIDYVIDSLESGWITTAYNQDSYIGKFEKQVQEYMDAHGAVSLQSGTAAIHMALALCGVGKGDKVFCSDLTFAASANPIKYLGAKPAFIDSELNTYNMSVEALKDAFNQCIPKAVIVVHLYGMPANMNEILKLCDAYGVPVIEDAAEAFGATYYGRYAGAIGTFGCYSFNGNKMITAGGTGGMLLTRSERDAVRAAFLASQAKEPVPWYEHKEIGYNYKLANINAAFGYGQMEEFDYRLGQKLIINKTYAECFEGCEYIRMYPVKESSECVFGNAWLSCIEINPKCGITPARIIEKLAMNNIEARRVWKPLSLQETFAGTDMYGNYFVHQSIREEKDMIENETVAEYAFRTGLCLPSDTNMCKEDVIIVAGIIRNMVEGL